MTTIPQAVTDYASRLVDARKKAYVASCIACWNQGQPFVSEWPNLAAEYITDIQRKLRRYGLTEIQRPEVVEASPVEEWVTETVEVAPVVKTVRKTAEPKCKLCGKPQAESRTNLRGNHHACVEASVERQLARKPAAASAFFPAKLHKERPEAMPPKWEEAQNPFPTKSAKWQTGRYGNHGSYHMRGAHPAFLKAIGEYDKPAGLRINRPSRSKDAYVRSESLCSESMGGRPWNVVAAEMRGTKYNGWQAGDPTPDAVRPFPTMNTVAQESYAEAAG